MLAREGPDSASLRHRPFVVSSCVASRSASVPVSDPGAAVVWPWSHRRAARRAVLPVPPEGCAADWGDVHVRRAGRRRADHRDASSPTTPPAPSQSKHRPRIIPFRCPFPARRLPRRDSHYLTLRYLLGVFGPRNASCVPCHMRYRNVPYIVKRLVRPQVGCHLIVFRGKQDETWMRCERRESAGYDVSRGATRRRRRTAARAKLDATVCARAACPQLRHSGRDRQVARLRHRSAPSSSWSPRGRPSDEGLRAYEKSAERFNEVDVSASRRRAVLLPQPLVGIRALRARRSTKEVRMAHPAASPALSACSS